MPTQRRDRLTERDVSNAQPGDVLAETCTRGLLLQVSPRGIKTWVFRYRGHPREGCTTLQRSKGLGSWPAISLVGARKLANACRGIVEGNGDPLENEREAARHREEVKARAEARQTFAVAADRFYRVVVEPKYRTRKNARHLLKYASAAIVDGRAFGVIAVTDITPEIGEALYGALVECRKVVLANRILGLLQCFWKWAAKPSGVPGVRGLPSPFAGIEMGEEKSRTRVLSDTELAAVWTAAGELEWPGGPFVRLLTLTGCRGKEILGLRWQPDPEERFGHVDLKEGLLVFPGGATKNGKPHVVYLNDAMRSVLRMVPRQFVGPFLFGKNGKKPGACRPGVKLRLDEMVNSNAWEKAWVFHDLRRTLVTGMQGLGVQEHVLKKLINHTGFASTFGVYALHQYEKERRAAFDAWATHVLSLVSSTAAKSA